MTLAAFLRMCIDPCLCLLDLPARARQAQEGTRRRAAAAAEAAAAAAAGYLSSGSNWLVGSKDFTAHMGCIQISPAGMARSLHVSSYYS